MSGAKGVGEVKSGEMNDEEPTIVEYERVCEIDEGMCVFKIKIIKAEDVLKRRRHGSKASGGMESRFVGKRMSMSKS